ncbi:MAG TPA: tRNA (cytidine(56)-2'-O)-methyltransferase [Euryarchaeota archaeon]|nr:tRNA 2'-O-methylase [archaeon BMS3Bbin15]HDL15338.1 tRNA (cytidine(56)-2'-O)-methyltransferase [Euryarchaeota archaeon]
MIVILRLGHRPVRDKRITTHVALTARALGARGIILTEEDKNIVESVEKVVENWGGDFFIRVEKDWRLVIKSWQGIKIHLTMYGMPFQDVVNEINMEKDILIIVGAEKVPGEVFRLVDYNIAIGNQPHSEVSALALFLDRLTQGSWLNMEIRGKLRVIPSEREKKVVRE